MAKKYYAVRKGKKAGIYQSWAECKAMVDGYSGAQYKSFLTLEEAKTYIGEASECKEDPQGAVAYVDGSFNSVTAVYGYGGFVLHDGQKEYLSGSGADAEMASMRNVAGEVLGSMAAIEKAIELGLPQITIYYDYMGIEMWAKGLWKRNKKGTIAYYDYVQSVRDQIEIAFCKVKGHSGVEGNEEADRLAKQAVGILEETGQ